MLRHITVFILLSVLGFSVYSNTLNVPFHYDDFTWIADNRDIHIESPSFGDFLKICSMNRSVSMLTFALNYYFGGTDVRGYHLVNIVVHILAAFGLFLLTNITLSTVCGRHEREHAVTAFMVGVLWLCNPIQTQAVTYIVQRMTSLAAMFYVFSIFFYAKGRLSNGSGRRHYFLLCILSSLLAFGSKENALLLPFFLFIYEVVIIRKGDWGLLKDKRFYLPALAACLFFLTVGLVLYSDVFSAFLSPYAGMGYVLKERLFTQARVFFFYVSLFLFPLSHRFSIEHGPTLSRSITDPLSTVFAVAGLILIMVYAAVSSKRRPFYSFFLIWLLGNLAIESFNMGLMVMSEHRMYLPGMGLAVLLGKWIADISSKWKRLAVFAVILLTFQFSYNSYVRNFIWKDEATLWADAVKKVPYSVVARTNLGIARLNEELIEDAISELEIARSINPRDPIVRYHLGVAFFDFKVYDKAIPEFRYVWKMGFDSLAGRPTIDTYFLKMARSFIAHGNTEKGRELLLEASTFHPENVKVKELLEKLEAGKLTGEDLMPEGW